MKVESATGNVNAQTLKTYGRDLVEIVGKLDPVIGRDEEIRRVVRILSRTKNNQMLIGEPGVRKMAVVEGLAHRIVRRDVPSNLEDVRLVALRQLHYSCGHHAQPLLPTHGDGGGSVLPHTPW